MARTRFDAVAHAKSMRSQGFWIDKNYDEFLRQWIEKSPDKLALLAYRSDRPDGRRFTYAELGDRVSRAAASLKRMGIGRGDIISVQLPNWWEFAVIALAAFRVGAVVNPLMPIFREHELSYMLGFAATKVFVVPKLFRGFDHEAMAMSLRAELPELQHILVVDGDGPDGFEAALLSSEERLPPSPAGDIGALPADEMAVLMFTSGTTGSPKGVMHCLNTLMACNVALAGRFGLDSSRHHAGLLAARTHDGVRRRDAARSQDRRERHFPGCVGAKARRLHHGGRRRHIFRRRRDLSL